MHLVRLQGFKLFGFIWLGQVLSLIGSGLTGFALGVWVYQQTGSVSDFAIIMLTNTLPAVIAAPFAGVVADRFDRRLVMMFSDFTAALGTMTIFLLLLTGNLQVWHIYILTTVTSAANAFQSPAYQATVSLLVPKQHLGRANGMVQMAEAISVVVSPLLAGLLMKWIGMTNIILIDLITATVAISSLFFVRFPRVVSEDGVKEKQRKEKGSVLREIKEGWRYIVDRPGLRGLLIYFAVSNFTFGFLNVGITPLTLSFASEAQLGMVMSLSGIGMIIGGLLVSIWGGPKRRIHGLLFGGILSGIALSFLGYRESVVLVSAMMMIIFILTNICNASSQAIWQSKVESQVQGRVFALRRMIAISLSPLAYIVAGPLIDYVMEPLMAEGGALASTVGAIIGTGQGRGIALTAVIIGLITVVINIVAYLHPRIRNIETELPDVIPSTVTNPAEAKTAVAEA